MKQVLQHARTGEVIVEEVPAPQLLPGHVLVRIAASVVSAGTERASSEFARKSLFQKAKSRPDLVRDVISKAQRDGIFSAIQTDTYSSRPTPKSRIQQRRHSNRELAKVSLTFSQVIASPAPAPAMPFMPRWQQSRAC